MHVLCYQQLVSTFVHVAIGMTQSESKKARQIAYHKSLLQNCAPFSSCCATTHALWLRLWGTSCHQEQDLLQGRRQQVVERMVRHRQRRKKKAPTDVEDIGNFGLAHGHQHGVHARCTKTKLDTSYRGPPRHCQQLLAMLVCCNIQQYLLDHAPTKVWTTWANNCMLQHSLLLVCTIQCHTSYDIICP